MKAPSVRNLLLGLAALLMLGHSLVPHDHSGSNPPKFILWQLFSVDLGGDHLQHFAPASCDVAPEDVDQVQLPDLCVTPGQEPTTHWIPQPRLGQPRNAHLIPEEHLSSWSRRPPPSSLA
ncbi:MAG: hypothetical protein RJA06_1095 [Bacteroidota bacterium]|jgi:hypothetical protein